MMVRNECLLTDNLQFRFLVVGTSVGGMNQIANLRDLSLRN